MGVLRSDLPSRLRRRMCLTCGFNGPELQGDPAHTAFICPRCAADLYARPARSYAELEGLDRAVAEVPDGDDEWMMVDGLWTPAYPSPPRSRFLRLLGASLRPFAAGLGWCRAQLWRIRTTRGVGWFIGVRQPRSAAAVHSRRRNRS